MEIYINNKLLINNNIYIVSMNQNMYFIEFVFEKDKYNKFEMNISGEIYNSLSEDIYIKQENELLKIVWKVIKFPKNKENSCYIMLDGEKYDFNLINIKSIGQEFEKENIVDTYILRYSTFMQNISSLSDSLKNISEDDLNVLIKYINHLYE